MRKLYERLSDREVLVLALMGKGWSSAMIGRATRTSAGTVRWHRRNIYGKFGVSKREEALAIARAERIIEPVVTSESDAGGEVKRSRELLLGIQPQLEMATHDAFLSEWLNSTKGWH